MPFSSSIEAERREIFNVDVGASQSLAFGLGYNFRNRFSTELRYGSNKQILGDEISWSSNYASIGLILGYTFF